MAARTLGERFSVTDSFYESNSIFEAKDNETGNKVLVKIVPLLPKEMKRWTKYENELRVIGQLNHPGIIKIMEWGDCDGGKYIAFEHIDGVRLSEARLSVTSSIRVLLRVAEAVKSMHSVELIHRDLRPENIVLYDQTNLLIKLIDFGSSASEETRLRQIKPNEIIKTLAWISPEALRNEPITLSSNLYQLGLIGYLLLTGNIPYKEDTPSSLIWQIQHMNPLPVSAINPRVPVALENMLKRLLRKDPESRFEKIDDVIEILKELAKQENISSTFSIRTGLLLGRGRIIGRSKELNRLSVSLKEQSRAEVFQIRGDMGIGKTRLIQEIASQARMTDIPSIIIGCDLYHKTKNLSTISQIVAEGANMLGTGMIGKSVFKNILVKLCPELSDRIITANTSEIDIYELERQAMPALKWLFEAMSMKNRVLLILDDAEFMDDQSHRLLQKLMSSISDLPVTFIAASRKESSIPYSIKIELEPLSKKDILIMLHENLGTTASADDLPEISSNISKGNPLMIELLLSGLAANKGLDESGRLTLTPEKIPATLESLLEWQLPKLNQSVQDILSTAAIIGNSFDEQMLARVSGKSRIEIADSLDMGMLANLIVHYKSPSGYRYRFVTSQLTDLMVSRFQPKQRVLVHEQIIRQILAKQESHQDDDIWNLIGHLRETGNVKLLIDKLIRASDILSSSHELENSIEIAKEAYQLSIQSADTQLETKAVINLAKKMSHIGELDKSLELLEAILKTAKRIGIDQLSESDLQFNLALIHSIEGNTQKSQELAQESFKIISRIGDDERLIQLHLLESMNTGDYDADLSLRQTLKSTSLVEKFPDNTWVRGAFNSLSQAYLNNGNIELAKQAIVKAKESPKKKSNLVQFFQTYIIEAEIALLEGNIGEAQEIVENIEREGICKKSPAVKIGTDSVRASIALAKGAHQESVTIYQNVVSLNLQVNAKISAIKTLLKLCRAFIDAGETDGAKYSLFQAQNLVADSDNPSVLNSIILLESILKYQEGEFEKSGELVHTIQSKNLPPFDKILFRALSVRLVAKRGDYRRALAMLSDEMLLNRQFLLLPTVSYALGMVKAEILFDLLARTSEMALAQKTLALSKSGLLGQDLPAMLKQSLDLAYVNTLYSGIRTQQPKASFALAKLHCLMASIEKQNAQLHRDECIRLIEMTTALANDLCMPTLAMKAQSLEAALKSGQAPVDL